MYTKFMALLGRFRVDRSGVTAIEYGVIAAAIVVLIIATVFFIGTKIEQAFQNVQQQLP